MIDWNSILGPIKAEEFENEEEIKNCFVSDSFWSKMLKISTNYRSSNLFLGRRGCGKTMLLKESVRILMETYETNKILPVEISFTAYLRKFSFPRIGEFTDYSKELTRILFSGYFNVILIKSILESIKLLSIQPIEREIEIFDVKLDLKKNPYLPLEFLNYLIKILKREIVPKNILSEKSKEFKGSFSHVLRVSFTKGIKITINDFEFSKTENYVYFEQALENVFRIYDIKRAIVFFDEITGLGDLLQGIFFDLLYSFRDNKIIKYKVFHYPHFNNYGNHFDPSDDAPSISLDRLMFTPNPDEFLDYYKNMLVQRIKIFSKDVKDRLHLEDYIDIESIKLASLCSGGNSRLFLNLLTEAANHISKESKIVIPSLNTALSRFVYLNFIDFLDKNCKRAGMNPNVCQDVLSKVVKLLNDRNKKTSSTTQNINLIGIVKNLYDDISAVVDMLEYCRILDFIDESMMGIELGRRYYVNVATLASRAAFKAPKGARQLFKGNDVDGLYDQLSKMRSSNVRKLIKPSDLEHKGIKLDSIKKHILDLKTAPKTDIKIKYLGLPNKLLNLLKRYNIQSATQILETGEEGLKRNYYGIGPKFARTAYLIAEEAISDMESALIPILSE